MGELKHELEDVSLDDMPQVLGKLASGTAVNSKPQAKLPAISLPAPPVFTPTRRFGKVCKRALSIGVRLVGIGSMVFLLAIAASGWHAHFVYNESVRNRIMSALCMVGLLLVALEDTIGVSKSAVVLLLAATLWTMLAVSYEPSTSEVGAHKLHHELNHGLQDVGSVILFLLPAMGVVESIDHFGGFDVATAAIRAGIAGNKNRLTPIICILTFLLSSVIDNLTSTIVAVKILRHVAAHDDHWRRRLGGFVVIAANAGGAWSPIGDVTTTMLWVQGKITAPKTVLGLFLPSVVCGLLPLLGLCCSRKGMPAEEVAVTETPNSPRQDLEDVDDVFELEGLPLWTQYDKVDNRITPTKLLALSIGIFVIILVPVLKVVAGLPPYLGMLLALALMWLISDAVLSDPTSTDEKSDVATHRGVIAALYKIDLTGLLFFTGVLLSVGALDSAGILRAYAETLVRSLGHNPMALCTILGLSSAVVDNVPLVEASIDMFKEVGTDDSLWQLVALAAGTGGSILSVGSIAGVTLMSMERVGFLWYCRHISLWALLGFAGGLIMYQVQTFIITG